MLNYLATITSIVSDQPRNSCACRLILAAPENRVIFQVANRGQPRLPRLAQAQKDLEELWQIQTLGLHPRSPEILRTGILKSSWWFVCSQADICLSNAVCELSALNATVPVREMSRVPWHLSSPPSAISNVILMTIGIIWPEKERSGDLQGRACWTGEHYWQQEVKESIKEMQNLNPYSEKSWSTWVCKFVQII